MHLVVLLLLSQVYEWTDAEGTHYTDDPSTIPKGVKAKTSEGGDISVIQKDRPVKPVTAPPEKPRTTTPPRGELDTCLAAREAVASAEKMLAQSQSAKDPGEDCMQRLAWSRNNRYAHTQYAQCMASRQPALDAQTARINADKARLEAAQDRLRRAQAAGCR